MLKFKVLTVAVAALAFFSLSSAEIINLDNGLSAASQGGTLPGSGDYDWWYGCSATSAGMMMGYYDRNGYDGKTYDNFLPGATAEANTFGNSAALVNQIIASDAHIAEYYRGPNPADPYGGSGDDNAMGDGVAGWHANNCLADFMGTSQDATGNSNGSTTFYFFNDGSKLTYTDVLSYGISEYDGMYGITEFVKYSGYDVVDAYSQYTDNVISGGFSFNDYKNEIDAGRVVMIQVEGHSMFGYGYEGNNMILHDTWTEGAKSMTWGGSYSGLGLYGVTCLTIAGGTPISSVPEPATILMLLLGFGALSMVRKKKN